VTITGGKGTTMRAMAETTADVVCDKLGVDAVCRTKEVVLLPYWAYYH
jgi:glycerol-3-phosphate dehydrogenase